MGTHLFLPGQQNAVVDGNLDLDGDLVEIRGRVPACRKRLRGWAVYRVCIGERTGAPEQSGGLNRSIFSGEGTEVSRNKRPTTQISRAVDTMCPPQWLVENLSEFSSIIALSREHAYLLIVSGVHCSQKTKLTAKSTRS